MSEEQYQQVKNYFSLVIAITEHYKSNKVLTREKYLQMTQDAEEGRLQKRK